MALLMFQLYGLFFSAAATKLMDEVSVSSLIDAFESGVSAIMKYGRSEPGDRTMVSSTNVTLYQITRG